MGAGASRDFARADEATAEHRAEDAAEGAAAGGAAAAAGGAAAGSAAAAGEGAAVAGAAAKGAGKGGAPPGPPPAKGTGKGGAPPGPPPAKGVGKGAAPPPAPPAKGAGKGAAPPPAPPAKGAGKGAPPPPGPPPAAMPTKGAGKGLPPPPAKGAGKGAGPAKGAGKGKVPPPPQERRSQAVGAAPPPELEAPAGSARLRAQQPLHSAEGTLWEGLDPWSAGGAGVLHGTVIDFERLQQLWGPMPEPPLPAERSARREGIPRNILQQVEIAAKAQKLEADLVRRGLTEDADLLTAQQADVLYTAVLPALAAAQPYLAMIVQERGVQGLGVAEAVLWALSNIPLVEARVRVVYEQHLLDEDVRQVQRWVEKATAAVASLKGSQPVRTVLQTILAVRNILAQRGHAGYAAGTLANLPQERLPRHRPTQVDPVTGELLPLDMAWVREHNPSVLALAAEMLESTHEHRCRLRFLRMLAVGRCVKQESPCRIVWSFLDDLHESPRDALPALAECTSGLCNRDLVNEISRQAMKCRQVATNELVHLRHNQRDPNTLFARQLDVLRGRFAEAVQAHDDACNAISGVALELCRLGGEPARPHSPAVFEGAGEVLRSLRLLGMRLDQEMAEVHERRRQLAKTDLVEAGRNATRRRRWAQVDTAGHTVVVTSDPDIIRQLRWRPMEAEEDGAEGGQQQAEQASGQEGAEAKSGETPAEARAREEREATFRHFSDLIHGGAEGVYRRDPATGRWGRRLDGVDGTGGQAMLLGGPHVGP